MIREVTGQKKPDPTLAALTPIGLWALNRWLVEQGVPAPVVGDLADAPLVDLIGALVNSDPEIVDEELAGWVAHRGVERAAAELQTFLQAADNPAQRLLALTALGLLGEQGAATAHRLRAGGGIPGSLATMWLLSTDAIEPSEVTLRETMLGFVDQLSALVDEAFAGHPVRDQIGMITECAHRTPRPAGRARRDRRRTGGPQGRECRTEGPSEQVGAGRTAAPPACPPTAQDIRAACIAGDRISAESG